MAECEPSSRQQNTDRPGLCHFKLLVIKSCRQWSVAPTYLVHTKALVLTLKSHSRRGLLSCLVTGLTSILILGHLRPPGGGPSLTHAEFSLPG